MGFKKVVMRSLVFVFEYDTVKIVSINSQKLGLMFRFIQLLILTYVIGYVIVYKKGYQNTESGISGIISKVKGVSFTNSSDKLVWDVADFVIPPQEDSALFITTNALITRNQTQGKCVEDEQTAGAKCKSDTDCVALEPILLGDGVKTGKCTYQGLCEIYAWCPVENSTADAEIKRRPLLRNVNNFTIFIKNNIEFRQFKVFRSNIPSSFNQTSLNTCRYNSKTNSNCPIFTVGQILNDAKTEFNDIAKIGGVISININWDCNLDFKAENCFPSYSFGRLDTEKNDIAVGWNFRYANYYYEGGIQYRDLIKAYGIRFLITVSSKAGRFEIIPLTMNIGSGIALLGIATLICDFVVIYCLRSRKRYFDAKYQLVSGDDAYKPFSDSVDMDNS